MRIRTVAGHVVHLSVTLRAVLAIAAVLALSGVAHAQTTRLYGQGCGGDLVDKTGTLPAMLSGSASAACTVGGTTTGSSSEAGVAGPGILAVSVETLHDGPGTAFQSSMQAQFSGTVVFGSPTPDPINVRLLVVVQGQLTADAGTGYGIDLNSTVFGHLAGYNSSCACGIGFPPLDGLPHVLASVPVAVPVNVPVPLDLVLQAGVGAGGWPDHIALDLLHGVTLNPGAVFVVPAGITVNGPGLNISDNKWTDPTLSGVTISNTTLTSLPPLPAAIAGDLTISNNPNLTAADLSGVTGVTGNVVVTGNGAAPVTVGSPAVGGSITLESSGGTINLGSPNVGGSITLDSSGGTINLVNPNVGGNLTLTTTSGAISMGSPTVTGGITLETMSGDITVSGGSAGNAIGLTTTTGSAVIANVSTPGSVTLVTTTGTVVMSDVSAGTSIDLTTISGPVTLVNVSTGGDLSLTGGSGAVNVSGGSVAGNTTITTVGSPGTTATTGGGTTTVTMTNGVATMSVELPANAYTVPVAFSVAPVDPAAMPVTGVMPGGGAATLTTLAAYQFTFAVPALNAAATLDFGVPLAALSAALQSDVLAALTAGRLTLATLGDAPGSAYQTFDVCPAGVPPVVNGCVGVTPLDAAGQPIPPGSLVVPAIIAFNGVVGHFSRWGVVIAKDAQAPTFAGVPASFSVVTAGTSAVVTYATPTATDAVDGSVGVACVPASGSSFPVGANAVTCTAKDSAGNTATAGFAITVVRDAAPPAIAITTPVANAIYALGTPVKAAYSCTDALSPVALCAGPVAAGANIDTAAPGPRSFTVNAADSLGNAASATVSYTVAAAAAGPDLVVAALTASATRLQRGHDLRVDVTTRNQGTARSRATFTRFYLAAGPVRTPQARQLHERQVVPSLAPGAANRWADSVEIDDTTPPGAYYLLACADDRGDVAESDETNNCTALATPIEVTR
ncbi:MAG: CARDB domain-containing protein [Burkholderiales bacterium]